MANQVSASFSMRFLADGTSSVITWDLKSSPLLSNLFNFDIAKNLPTGFTALSDSTGLAVTATLAGSKFTVTYAAPPAADHLYNVSVEFLF